MVNLEIEVDCNSDVIRLKQDDKTICETGVKYPLKYIQFFSEIFNRLELQMNHHISITKIDEDNKTTLEEW